MQLRRFVLLYSPMIRYCPVLRRLLVSSRFPEVDNGHGVDNGPGTWKQCKKGRWIPLLVDFHTAVNNFLPHLLSAL